MYLNLNDRIDSYNDYKSHMLNEHLTRFIAKKAMRKGDSVCDLGANVGFHTHAFAGDVGPNGLVHAFEPNPKLWSYFTGISNIRLWPVAVGEAVKIERLVVPLAYDQVASIVDPRDFMGDVDVKIFSVPQVTLDSLEELSERALSFIKIDIERRELFAIKGAMNILLRDQPYVIFENNTPEIEDLLNSIDYKVVCMIYGHDFHRKICNVLAVSNKKTQSLNHILPSVEDVSIIMDWIDSTD